MKIKPIQHRARAGVLSVEQLAEIKAATLHVLETVGVHFPSARALSVFIEHGAQVFLRVLVKGDFAARRAEKVSLPLVFRLPLGGSFVDFHITYRIYCHDYLLYKVRILSERLENRSAKFQDASLASRHWCTCRSNSSGMNL